VNTQQSLRLGTDNLKSNNKYSKIFFDENRKCLIFVPNTNTMTKTIYFILVIFLICSCSSTRHGIVKMPKQSYVKWYSKNSLKKYSKEFYRKDWTKRDTVFVPKLDTTKFN
jgi:hypothetical protein